MDIIHGIDQLRTLVKLEKNNGKSIGFVPTMGFLHEGHLSLMREAKKETDFVVVSIFVNPTQFGPNEDLESYPRDLTRDLALCASVGVDLIFVPEVEEMYPEGYSTYVVCEGEITKKLCGASRPTHFKGVTSVVAKLFNMVSPHKAFFGQKDAQQVAIIKKMVRELNIDIEIVSCPIVREPDGLAMSSRNTYLSPEERVDARVLSQALNEVKQQLDSGVRDVKILLEGMKLKISDCQSAKIDYISIVNANTLEDIDLIQGEVLVALAVKIGKTRLIDNLRYQV